MTTTRRYMTSQEHDAMMAVRNRLYEALVAATSMRDQRSELRSGPNGQEYAWVQFEREVMHELVNRARADADLAPVTLEQVMAAECQAEGHVDYCAKFALYCAELAVGWER